MKHVLLAATAIALLTTGALADEAWDSAAGDIIYEAEVDGTAVFSYPIADTGEKGHMYIPGLAGNYDQRGTHFGYWIGPAPGVACDSEMVGADGLKSKDWGRLLITFHDPGFPTSWTVVTGNCFGPLEGGGLVGTPKTYESEPVAETPPPPPPPSN